MYDLISFSEQQQQQIFFKKKLYLIATMYYNGLFHSTLHEISSFRFYFWLFDRVTDFHFAFFAFFKCAMVFVRFFFFRPESIFLRRCVDCFLYLFSNSIGVNCTHANTRAQVTMIKMKTRTKRWHLDRRKKIFFFFCR